MITSIAVLGLSSLLAAAPGSAGDPCASTRPRGYTLLVEQDGRVIHCRDGKTTDLEPWSDERVVLQLPPDRADEPYRFRLVDGKARKARHAPKLFGGEIEVAEDLGASLEEIAASPESIGEALDHLEPAPPPEAAGEGAHSAAAVPVHESRAVQGSEAAKAKYLAVATPAFVDAVRRLQRDLGLMEGLTEQVERACKARGSAVAESARTIVAQRCSSGGSGATIGEALRPIRADLERFLEARKVARDALFDASLAPTSSSEADDAAAKAREALGQATTKAEALVASAAGAAGAAQKFALDLRILEAAFDLPAESESGQRLLLGRFPASGLFHAPDIYQVQLAKEPSPLYDLTDQAARPPPAPDLIVDRFQPERRDWFDLGIALMYSGGLPDHPALVGRLGQQQLTEQGTAGVSGGVLASLEPISIFCPGSAWAPIIRFPTIIVPFTLNPLTNYFIGGGIGLKEIGAINAGAHIALTRSPAPGDLYGTQFTSPVYLDHVTMASGLAAGYFVSVSLDLLGLARLIVGEERPEVRDVHSGSSLEPKR